MEHKHLFILDLPLFLVCARSVITSKWLRSFARSFIHPLKSTPERNSSNALRIHYIKHVSHFFNFIIVSITAAGIVDYDTASAAADAVTNYFSPATWKLMCNKVKRIQLDIFHFF